MLAVPEVHVSAQAESDSFIGSSFLGETRFSFVVCAYYFMESDQRSLQPYLFE